MKKVLVQANSTLNFNFKGLSFSLQFLFDGTYAEYTIAFVDSEYAAVGETEDGEILDCLVVKGDRLLRRNNIKCIRLDAQTYQPIDIEYFDESDDGFKDIENQKARVMSQRRRLR